MMPSPKICPTCKEIRLTSDFKRWSTENKDKFHYAHTCNYCVDKYGRKAGMKKAHILLVQTGKKWCSSCKRMKKIHLFWPKRSGRGIGYNSDCKHCGRIKFKNIYKTLPKHIKQSRVRPLLNYDAQRRWERKQRKRLSPFYLKKLLGINDASVVNSEMQQLLSLKQAQLKLYREIKSKNK